jgi:hypothetical protein
MQTGVAVPIEAIATLRRGLASLPARHPERKVREEAEGAAIDGI